MTLKNHIIVGVVGTALFYPTFGPWHSIVFFLSSVLIDVDHYWDYLWKSKFADWSPARMFRYYDEATKERYNKNNLGFSLFHTLEVFLILYFTAQYFDYDLLITVLGGMSFHMIFDVLHMARQDLVFVRAYSIVEYFLRKNYMKRHGRDSHAFWMHMFKLSAKVPKEK